MCVAKKKDVRCVLFLVYLHICVRECLLQNNIARVPSSRATSGFPQYCAFTCARVGCTGHDSCEDSKSKKWNSSLSCHDLKNNILKSSTCWLHAHTKIHTNMWHELRECLQARRFWVPLLPICVRSWCNWRAGSVDSKPKVNGKKRVHYGSAFEPGASGLHYHYTSICVRSWCNWRASCVDSNPKKKTHACRGKGFRTFAMCNKACVSSLLYILKLRLSPWIPIHYFETRIFTTDSHSNWLRSEDTENNLLVYWSFL